MSSIEIFVIFSVRPLNFTVRKPSYDVLYKLIRELSISPDLIFYPEKPTKESEIENLIRLLYNCDERSLEVVKATAKALIDTAPDKSDND